MRQLLIASCTVRAVISLRGVSTPEGARAGPIVSAIRYDIFFGDGLIKRDVDLDAPLRVGEHLLDGVWVVDQIVPTTESRISYEAFLTRRRYHYFVHVEGEAGVNTVETSRQLGVEDELVVYGRLLRVRAISTPPLEFADGVIRAVPT